MRATRIAAAGQAAALELPTSAEEVWRYSLVDDLDLDEFAPTPPGDPTTVGDLGAIDAWVGTDRAEVAAVVVTVDDRVLSIEVSDRARAEGLEVIVLADPGADEPGGEFERPTGLFGTLNTAFGLSPLLVRTARSAEVRGVVHVVRVSTVEGGASFPRLLVDAGANSSLRVVEHHRSTAGRSLVVPRTELVLAADARLNYLAVNDLGPATWQLAAVGSSVGQSAHLVCAAAAFGGFYARLRTDCRLVGRGASADLLAAYFGDADQTLDFRTFQDHQAPDTTSNLLFKGALDDRSRSVYTGLIKVRPEGRNTNAFQTNHNVKLSDDAWAESVPNLEIETNDVQCSHASTVGPIDEEQRFYLEARGIRPVDAERLVLTGFFEEVIGHLALPGTEGPLRQHVADKVAARVAREVAA